MGVEKMAGAAKRSFQPQGDSDKKAARKALRAPVRGSLSRASAIVGSTRPTTIEQPSVQASGKQSPRLLSTPAGDLSSADAFVEFIGAHRIATWGMLYCGGSQPVVDALRGIENDCGITLRVEKFDW